jgi:hypothetical protein
MVFNKFVVWNWSIEFSWRSGWCSTKKEGLVGNVFVLVCYLIGKWLKNLFVVCVSLFY